MSVEKSEYLSDQLRRRGVRHEVLNAKHHEREAAIVAEAGRKVWFASPSAFSVAYKQQIGHLPRAAGSGRAG